MSPSPLSIYVHVPFCERHCAYCDFNTTVEREAGDPRVERVVAAMELDIRRSAAAANRDAPLGRRPVSTVFFGGGTPTFLTAQQIGRLLQAVRESFPVQPDAEVSSEANPGSADAEKFGAMRRAGFNRLSIGVQALQDSVLAALDRNHTAREALRAVRCAREACFHNLSLDLMFGLPTQTPGLWEETLYGAVEMAPEHLSLYSLIVEPGTRFERLRAGGKLKLPGEEAETQMAEAAARLLPGAGYEQYEVSNWAHPGFRCRHNQVYWRNEEYLGVGPGAVSYLDGRRFKREPLPSKYAAKIEQGAILEVESERLSPEAALGETLMLGLRTADGVSCSELAARFGIDPRERYQAEIARLQMQDMLQISGDLLCPTACGLALASTVALEFL